MQEEQRPTSTDSIAQRNSGPCYAFVRYVLPPAVPWLALIVSLIILVLKFDDAKHVGDVLRIFAPTAGITSLGIGISLGISARRAP